MILCIVLGVAWYSFIKSCCLNSVANCGPRCGSRWWSDVYLLSVICSANLEGQVCLNGVAASICSYSIDVGPVGLETE
jgi:hypothetical protein